MLTLLSVVVVYNQLLTEYCEPVCLFQFDSNIYPPNRQLSFDMILGTRVVDVAVLLSQIINCWTLTTRKGLVILSEDQTCQLKMLKHIYEPFKLLGHVHLKK